MSKPWHFEGRRSDVRLAIFTLGVYPYYAHGAEIGIFYLAKELALHNNEVSLHLSELIPHDAATQISGLPNGLKIIFSPGIRLRFVYNISYVFASLHNLANNQDRPAVLAVNVPTLLSLMTAYCARLTLGIPYIVFVHGPSDIDSSSSLIHSIQCFFMQRAARVVCVSRDLAQMVAGSGLANQTSCKVIPNGYDEGEVEIALTHAREKPSKPELAFVGSLDENKDPITTIRSLQLLLKKVPNVFLNIVGQGPLEIKAREFVAQARLQDFVHFHREMEHSELLKILSRCTLLIVSSHREGMPTVVIEAFAMGIPVVATKVGGLPEIIRAGENGFLVPVEDSESIAECVERILTDYNLRKKLSQGARETASALTWSKITKRYEGLFDSIVAEQ